MIPSEFLFPYIASNVLAAGLLVVAIASPRVARALFIILFLGAGVVNGYAAITVPEIYVSGFGDTALLEIYRSFINGFFHDHTLGIVLMIALGQMCVAVLLAGRRRMRQAGVIGGTLFLLAIAPLGIGSAFPASLLLAAALLMTSWRERPHTVPTNDHHPVPRVAGGN